MKTTERLLVQQYFTVFTRYFNALNELRKDPKGYAEKYLSPRLSKFEGNVFKRGDGVNQMTHEGAAAVQEAISVLSETPPITLFEKVPLACLWQL